MFEKTLISSGLWLRDPKELRKVGEGSSEAFAIPGRSALYHVNEPRPPSFRVADLSWLSPVLRRYFREDGALPWR